MSLSPAPTNRTLFFERLIEKYPKLCTAFAFLLILLATGLVSRIGLESEQIASQQEAELEAWEQGFKQGQQAAE